MHAVFPVMSGIHSQDSLQLLPLLTTYSGLRSSVTSYVTPSLSTAPTTLSTVDIHGSRRSTRSFSDHSPPSSSSYGPTCHQYRQVFTAHYLVASTFSNDSVFSSSAYKPRIFKLVKVARSFTVPEEIFKKYSYIF